jgi:hypothetical protein
MSQDSKEFIKTKMCSKEVYLLYGEDPSVSALHTLKKVKIKNSVFLSKVQFSLCLIN